MLDWIISYSVLIIAVVVIRYLFKGKISLRLQYGLWLLVAIRLLIPINLGVSSFSVGHLSEQLIRQSDQYVWIYNKGSEMREAGMHTSGLTTAEVDKELSEAAQSIKKSTVQYMEESGRDNAEKDFRPQIQTGNLLETKKAGENRNQEEDSRLSGMIKTEQIVEKQDTTRQIKYDGKLSAVIGVLKQILPWIWGVVAFIMGVVFVISNKIFEKKVKCAREEVAVQYAELPVFVTGEVETPCLFGMLRPQIYVTKDVFEDDVLLRHSIYHEMTHYKHGDLFWALIRIVCLILHWYNPLVWLAVFLSRQDGELACDEGTILRLGEEERKEYGRTLIQLTYSKPQTMLSASTTMSAGKKSVKERIHYIGRKSKTRLYAVVMVGVLMMTTVGCTFTEADSTKVSVENSESMPEETISEQKKAGNITAVKESSEMETLQYDVVAEKTEQVVRYDEKGRRIITLYDGMQFVNRTMYQDFNANNEKYKIEIISREEQDFDSIVRGENCPDLVFTYDWKEIGDWYHKGYLTDLTPYLDASKILKREDLREKLLKQFTIGDGLYALPQYTALGTLMVTEGQVNGDTPWTVDEFLNWLENNPKVFSTSGTLDEKVILEYCLMGNLEQYVDLNQGKSDFSKKEFQELLTRIKNLNLEEMENIVFMEIEPEKICLMNHWLYDGGDIARLESMLEDNVVPIGYPNNNGETKCNVLPVTNYAILEKSSCKEGAFAFIEYCLTYDTGKDLPEKTEHYDGCLWTLESKCDSNISFPYDTYVDYASSPDDKTVIRQEYTVTQEHEDRMLQLYEGAQIDTFEMAWVRKLILDSAEYYFRFNKPLEKTCEEIQSKVEEYFKDRNLKE